jgi:Tfp pilus assembly protein PilN
MNKLRLDYQKVSTFPWLGVCLSAVVLIILVMLAMYFVKVRNQLDELQNNIERSSMKKTAHMASAPTSEKGRQEQTLEIKNANEVLHRLSVPWEILFKAVESSSGSKITLLSLEPDFEKKQVKISGEASNYKALMSYITQLQGQEIFESAYLQNHEIMVEDPDKPVRFTLLANWRDLI